MIKGWPVEVCNGCSMAWGRIVTFFWVASSSAMTNLPQSRASHPLGKVRWLSRQESGRTHCGGDHLGLPMSTRVTFCCRVYVPGDIPAPTRIPEHVVFQCDGRSPRRLKRTIAKALRNRFSALKEIPLIISDPEPANDRELVTAITEVFMPDHVLDDDTRFWWVEWKLDRGEPDTQAST